MPAVLFRRLRRCRALFALALCAWLALAGAAWAQDGCCAGMGSQAMASMVHHDGMPPAPHADIGGHVGCTCAHLAAALPVAVPSLPSAAPAWQAGPALPAMAPERPSAPPLRPPLA
ncbi:hypothetical protein QMK61_14510 [Fulvimonas sp. R45]|uniref:hypothetical protein n=1 Tax=Fulvimonas sp. R45 TaxID=3045937 RepID=UPI00265F5C0D|nr:hypothetical protein [Fulvimonas sp. R45]MDO1530050.1 hypothetical protein [Fulvimonas sp. R45]